MSTATSAFVEQIAVCMEAEGWPRVAGRLFALLLISDEPQSLDDLADELDVSKASVSINARYLEDRGKAERVSMTGDRRDYYQIGDDMIERSMEDRMARVKRIQQAVATARANRVIKSERVLTRLELFDSAHRHILEAQQRVLDELRAKRKKLLTTSAAR